MVIPIARLDVGCGDAPTGTVNVDLGPVMVNVGAHPRSTKADLYCDALHLPFRDQSFDEAYSSHVIEHLLYPGKLLSELERVGRKVIVKCPHRFAVCNQHDSSHLWGFTKTWFHKHGYRTDQNYLPRRLLFFGVMWIHEIIAEKP